jgi:hypothetical protein
MMAREGLTDDPIQKVKAEQKAREYARINFTDD